jgi:2'-5' RNA ligase
MSIQPVSNRLFFAVWPDEELRAHLHDAARRCLAADQGRLVAPDNLHVTLAFLGPVDGARKECCEQAASRLVLPGFSLVLDRLGYWPRKQILWAGCSAEPPELGALVSALQAGLDGCGFEPETRPFHVHVTLARHVHRDPFPGPGRARREHAMPIPPLEWRVREFMLVESDTRPSGALYTHLRSWPLT